MTYTEFIVENLMSGLHQKGRSLYMDNFYNSVQLPRKLLQKKIMLRELYALTASTIQMKLLLKN